MKKILCIGGATMDILVRPVDQLPQTGTLKSVNEIATFVGGCAANAAIDLGRLGAPVGLCCKVGQDAFGSFIIDELKNNYVDISGVVVDKTVGTSASVVNITSHGERSFLYNPGSTSEFSLEDIPDSVLEKYDIIFIASALILTKFDGTPAAKLFEKARKMGKYTVMDTVWDFEDKWMEKIKPSIPYVDLFMPSIEEAIKLTGEEDIDKIADIFFSLGTKNVIIKMGSKGAYVCENGRERFFSPPFLQEHPIDTNGAGDSFCAGFLLGIANNWNYVRSAEFANAVGSHCVMGTGAYSGIVSMKEIELFVEKQRGKQ